MDRVLHQREAAHISDHHGGSYSSLLQQCLLRQKIRADRGGSGATHNQKHGRGCVRIPPCGHNIRRRRLPEVNWYLSLVNGGPPRQGVPAAALCHVIPTLFAMLIGIFRAHPYYASRKYHPPFADRMAARLGVSLELAQPTGSCAPASVPTSADGGSSSAGPSSGTCPASEDAFAHSAQARPQAAHRSGGSRAEPADGTS